MSGPGPLCVGARRSVCVTHWHSPALSSSSSSGPRRSLSLSLSKGLYVSSEVCTALSCRYITRRSKISGLCRVRRSPCQAPALPDVREPPAPAIRSAQPMPSDPRTPAQITHPVRGPHIRVPAQISDVPATRIRVPPIRRRLRSACHPSSPVRAFFPGENPKPYCLGENYTIIYRIS